MSGSRGLWQRYDTTDADEAHTFIRETFMDLDARFASAIPGDVGMHSAAAALADLKVVRLQLAAPTWMRTRPQRDLNIVYVLGGTFTLSDRKNVHQARTGDVALTLPDRPQISEIVDHDVLTVRLPRALLEQVAKPKPASRAPICISTPPVRCPPRWHNTGCTPCATSPKDYSPTR